MLTIPIYVKSASIIFILAVRKGTWSIFFQFVAIVSIHLKFTYIILIHVVRKKDMMVVVTHWHSTRCKYINLEVCPVPILLAAFRGEDSDNHVKRQQARHVVQVPASEPSLSMSISVLHPSLFWQTIEDNGRAVQETSLTTSPLSVATTSASISSLRWYPRACEHLSIVVFVF
jgi:hypothetical protein